MESPGYELPILLLGAFRHVIDALHETLAARGFPEARPVHGLALQAIGPGAISMSELGRRLGVSKQAAAKTASRLEGLGYITRADDPHDARARLVARSERGNAMLRESALILAEQQHAWIAMLGQDGYEATIAGVRVIAEGSSLADTLAWLQAE
ncbi:MAG: MarR family winged helix-turn-helix transcriptional regulator [Thermomicrobiales bacterium]